MLQRSWTVVGLALVVCLALAASACGGESAEGAQVASLGGTSTQTETATTATSDDPQEVLLDYTECMRDEGIDLPDPDFSGGGGRARIQIGPGGADPDDPEFRAAQEKCQPILQSLRQQLDPERQEEFQDAALAFAKCMREHGIDMPDPDFSQGPGGGGGAFRPEGIDPDDPEFQEAREACDEAFADLGGRFEGGPGRGGAGDGDGQ